MSIQKYLKYEFTHKNAGFRLLCIDDFKILKIFNKLSKFSTIFHRETSQVTTPPPLPKSGMYGNVLGVPDMDFKR